MKTAPAAPVVTPDAPAADRRRVLLVDDHPIMRQGLAQFLGGQPDLAVPYQAATASQGLELARRHEPDAAVVDLTLKSGNGLDLVKDLHVFLPKLPILVLSMHDESIYAERALRAGAKGYVMKGEDAEKILLAVRRILSGGNWVSEAVMSRVLQRAVGSGGDHAGGIGVGEDPISERLTDRELQVLTMLGRGRGTRAVAADLRLSVKTVETYRANLKEKLGLADAPALVRFAVEWVHREGKGEGA